LNLARTKAHVRGLWPQHRERRLRYFYADDRAVPLRRCPASLAADREEQIAEGKRQYLQGLLRRLVLRTMRRLQNRGRVLHTGGLARSVLPDPRACAR